MGAMPTSKSTESEEEHPSISGSLQIGTCDPCHAPETSRCSGHLTLRRQQIPEKARVANVHDLTPQQMKRFARATSRITGKVLTPFRCIANSCFTTKTVHERKRTKRAPILLRCDESYEASHFSSECNEEALRKATSELECLVREQAEAPELGRNRCAVVQAGGGEHRLARESVESADDEIDISGISRVSVEKIRLWEVRNIRMFRESRSLDAEKNTLLRKMSAWLFEN